MSARKMKSFSNSNKKKKGEPIPFEIEGSARTEQFVANPSVPGAVLLELIGSSESDGAESAKSITTYLKSSMSKAEFKKFDNFIKDPENEVELDTLVEVVSYLIEEQSSRPTEASTESDATS